MTDLRYVAIVILFTWMVIDSVFVFRHKTGKAENRDRFSLLLLILGGPVALWISIGFAFSPIGALHSPTLQWLGLMLMAVGITVRSAAIVQLGRFHTPNVAVRADHQLRITGLYRLVRHPSYLGALVAYLGFGLALGNWASVLVLMGLVPGLYLYRIHEEDAALLAAFGDAYRAHCLRTKRLIPWVY